MCKQIMKVNDCLLSKFLNNNFSSCFMERPGFFASRNDLIRGQNEPISTSVTEFHAIGVGNASLPQSPIHGSTRSNIQQTRDTSNIIGFLMNIVQGFVTLKGQSHVDKSTLHKMLQNVYSTLVAKLIKLS